VNYLIGDHLGSTSLVTDAAGNLQVETRYKPCPYRVLREGELRYSWTSGQSTTPAYKLPVYSFTGQRSYMDDPSTNYKEIHVITMEQFTEWLMGVVIFVSPLFNIYFLVRLATTRTRKLLTGGIGFGLYLLYLFLIFYSFFFITYN
jgi:hypothetical protein